MIEILYCTVAGLFISIQSSFNSHLSEKVGGMETVTITHLIGLITSLIILFFVGNGDISRIGEVNKLYLTGGVLGVAIVFGVTAGVGVLGPSMTMGIVVISQLAMGVIIELGGLFGHDRLKFSLNQPLGIAIMIVGLMILKMK